MFPKNNNLGFLFPSTFAEQCWYCTKMKNLENTKKQINHHDHISGTSHDSFRCNRTWHAAHSIVLSLKYRSDGLRLDTPMTHPTKRDGKKIFEIFEIVSSLAKHFLQSLNGKIPSNWRYFWYFYHHGSIRNWTHNRSMSFYDMVKCQKYCNLAEVQTELFRLEICFYQ